MECVRKSHTPLRGQATEPTHPSVFSFPTCLLDVNTQGNLRSTHWRWQSLHHPGSLNDAWNHQLHLPLLPGFWEQEVNFYWVKTLRFQILSAIAINIVLPKPLVHPSLHPVVCKEWRWPNYLQSQGGGAGLASSLEAVVGLSKSRLSTIANHKVLFKKVFQCIFSG